MHGLGRTHAHDAGAISTVVIGTPWSFATAVMLTSVELAQLCNAAVAESIPSVGGRERAQMCHKRKDQARP
jgi:hypothetical protein